MMSEIAKIIAEQNDMFRQRIGDPFGIYSSIKGRYIMTQGIIRLTLEDHQDIIDKIRAFNAFTPDNDPYKEHDFGRFQLDENKQDILWKIDYYDPTYQYHSEDKSNPEVTKRILTVMLAHEY
jgi:hypothetical protein